MKITNTSKYTLSITSHGLLDPGTEYNLNDYDKYYNELISSGRGHIEDNLTENTAYDEFL